MNNYPSNIYLPGLNGLRAIAALSVVVSHITIAFPDFGVANIIGGWSFASQGVTLFFTISGFLITYLLLLEKREQEISIKKFYIRRILRIWPLYYSYLIIAIIFLILSSQLNVKSILYYFFFCANIPYIFGGSLFLIAHLWSIGVEEQFYLFWPAFVRFSKKRLLSVTLFLVIFLIALKFYVRYIIKDELAETFLDVNRFECMLIGAIGAILYSSQNKVFITIETHILAQMSAWVILFLIALGKINTPGPTENVLMSIITLTLIIGQIDAKSKIFNLDNKLFDFLGKISYGLYVIHPFIVYLLAKIFIELKMSNSIKITLIFLTVVFSTILFAHISYMYYEKPFLKLKSRFAIVKSQSSKY
jgi:peptidoglycan/LPS O-acetylase OafA/YrhL